MKNIIQPQPFPRARQPFPEFLVTILRMNDKFNFSRWIIHIAPGITWMILCPSEYRYAFAQSGTQPPENSNGIYTTLDPSMSVIILILISVFFLIAMFSIYVRSCSESVADGNALQPRVTLDLSRRRGLDSAVIETFPIFIYSEVKDLKIGKGTLECAVCLSEFEDDETLRLLPKCDHVFHPDCIDAWLNSHVTCPVCRAVLTPELKETVILTDSNNEFNPIQNNSTPELGEDQNRVVIDISNEQSSDAQVIETSDATSMRNRPLGLGIPGKFPRSHSTGHSLVLAGVNTERYTLKLPEEVRKQLMMSVKFKRTQSFNVILGGEGSSRGYKNGGGEGSSGGRNYVDRQGGRSDRWVFSTTPPFVSKMGPVNWVNKVGGREGDGSNSSSRMLLTAVKSPLNCLNVKVEQRGESSSAWPPETI